MILLGLDTSTRATEVAVWDTDADRRAEHGDHPPAGSRPRHTGRLLTLAARALAELGTDWSGIDRIAVGVGPGTFTGIRIGVATARALAAARAVPIVGVSTLRAVAGAAERTVPAAAGTATVAVLDARRGEVFAAAWDGAATLIAPRALPPQELARTLATGGRSWRAVGDGALAFREILVGAGIEVPPDGSDLHRVSALEICRLGSALAPAVPDDIEPEYLRLPDAEITRQRNDAR